MAIDPPGEPIHAGDTITAAVDMSRIHLFDKQTERAIAFRQEENLCFVHPI